ncbi:glycoside hydrolase family protein [Kriegella aquimaris]|uniref:Glycosyl hydrolases family 43 n=1 Tax=Kriegella aquimaris TaxID=192904 RepID=A0A1G9JD37_9FLAO|nr:hypothetical protein [Kriegella aquimaris]SDL35301.1 Glycosyl hydrolases family 43 [Kriegella aquimaris]
MERYDITRAKKSSGRIITKISSIPLLILLLLSSKQTNAQNSLLSDLRSPIIFKGNDSIAYRDPAILFHEDIFHLFYTLVKAENGLIYSYTASSKSKDLKHWSPAKIITAKNQNLNFCSPGNIIRFKDEWILSLQTYPRPGLGEKDKTRYGSADARVFIMRSKDLENWSAPELIKVKGADVKEADMGRMIDPYIVEDKDEKGKWWCFYKQNGVSMSYTYDFENWTYCCHSESGENVTVLTENDEYLLFHSPHNGIGIKRSTNLEQWEDWGDLIVLGQQHWDWAKGRITAGTVINLTENAKFGKYLMFFHGSGPRTEQEGDFDKNASLGIAWSDDLLHWNWPGKPTK